ncbi:MAG TPA: prephenate dehydratase [Alphaproteobacteria bacterium]
MPKQSGKIAFQGFPGAYSDMACRAVYPGRETLPCRTFEEAFLAVQDKKAALAMIPVDNTLAGRVADVHHLLPRAGLYIIGEYFHPVHHCLLGVKGADKKTLKHVHSHVHAIPQCRKVIKRLHLQAHSGMDTAGAAQDVARRNDPAHAAIASELAAEIYGLKILERNVEDESHNTTRFLILSREHTVPSYNKNTSFITSITFRTRNIPAALYKALGGFATNGVSMAKLESYVDPSFDVAEFYAEVEAHQKSPALKLALEELTFFAEETRVLGTYKAHPFRRK